MLTMTSLGAAGTVTGSKHLLEHDGVGLYVVVERHGVLDLLQG